MIGIDEPNLFGVRGGNFRGNLGDDRLEQMWYNFYINCKKHYQKGKNILK